MKRNILLINPPLYFCGGRPYSLDSSVPPLGLLYLAAYINKYSGDFKASIMDVTAQGLSLKELADKTTEMKPFAVGISAMTPQLQGCVELGAFLKESCSLRPYIFLGGPHISADPGFLMRFTDVFDYAITGEAEKTFLQSINNILNGGQVPRMQAGEAIVDLDTIPFPDKLLLDRKKYSRYESMIFSRGCPYYCYYCSRPAISKKIRYRSVGNLIAEIKYVYEFCGGRIDFQDDTFTIDKNRVVELCGAIIENNLNIEWRCNTRIDLVDEELLFKMKKAGCDLIHFGIESGNEKVREGIINKGRFSNKTIRDVIKFCKKIGIKAAGYFMIGHPGETKEDIEDTKKLIFTSGINLLGLSIPTPFPGSKLYEIARERGIINEQIIDRFAKKELGEGYVGNYPVLVSENITREYLFDVMRGINRKFYINLKTFWNRFREDVFSFRKIMEDAKDLFYLIIGGVSSRKPYLHKSSVKKYLKEPL